MNNTDIYEEILRKGCEENNVSYECAVDYFYRKKELEFDMEDISNFCSGSDFGMLLDSELKVAEEFNEGDYECIAQMYRDDYDCDLGIWSNIQRAVLDYIGTRKV